jgi:hypothetical protein
LGARRDASNTRLLGSASHSYQDEVDGVEELVRPCIAPDAPYRPWVVAVASNIYTYVLLHRKRSIDPVPCARFCDVLRSVPLQ